MPKHIGLPVKVDAPPAPRLPFVVPMPSPSVSEHVFKNATNDASLTDAQIALATLRVAVERIHQGAVGIFGDETLPEAAKHVQSFDFAGRVIRPALVSADAAVAKLSREIETVRTKTNMPMAVRDSLATEIRTALSRMAPTDRMKAVLASTKPGADGSIASAAIAGPALLSGLEQTQHDHLRLTWANERFPDDVKRVRELEKALVHLQRGGQLALAYSISVADRPTVDKARASQQRALEAMGAANRPAPALN